MSSTGVKGQSESTSTFEYNLDQFLQMMVDQDASDLIIKSDSPPAFRINNEMRRVDMDPLEPEHVRKLATDFLPEDRVQKIENEQEEYDGSYSNETGRFRVNVFLERQSLGMVFRHVKQDIRSFSELNLPPSIEKLAQAERGIVLVTGTTNSGKSTTLASLVDYINERERKHIITVEDPIEFVHDDKKSVITQREVGVDTKNYSTALKYVLRQNPDVILLGELRDEETMHSALKAAETGHLVYSTLHTKDAAQTIDRMIEFYPPDQHEQIRNLLAEYLVGICSQRMCARDDREGVVPAVELLFKNPTIQKLIRGNRIEKIRSAIHQGRDDGMQTFDLSLVRLHKEGMISEEEARKHCTSPENFPMYLEDRWPDLDTGVLGEGGGIG